MCKTCMWGGVRRVEVCVHFEVILVVMSCFVGVDCGGQKVLPHSNTSRDFETNSCTQILVLVVTMSRTFTHTCSFTTLFHYVFFTAASVSSCHFSVRFGKSKVCSHKDLL